MAGASDYSMTEILKQSPAAAKNTSSGIEQNNPAHHPVVRPNSEDVQFANGNRSEIPINPTAGGFYRR
jgi:hypothetical protein